MLKKIVKYIKTWINREIQAYKIEQEKQRTELEKKRIANQKAEHHHHWERIMKGQAMRDVGEEKEGGRMKAVVVDYVGRRRVREPFNPVFSRMDCVNWGERSNQYEKTSQR